MKTRIIQTRYWDDEYITNTDLATSHLYIYLLTCQYVNICGIFQLSPQKMILESHLGKKGFELARKNLEEGRKVCMYKGWVFVYNAQKNNNYQKSPDNKKAMDNELKRVPVDVLTYFEQFIDSSVDSSVDSTNKSKTINHKSEIKNQKSKFINNKSEIINQKPEIRIQEDIDLEKIPF